MATTKLPTTPTERPDWGSGESVFDSPNLPDGLVKLPHIRTIGTSSQYAPNSNENLYAPGTPSKEDPNKALYGDVPALAPSIKEYFDNVNNELTNEKINTINTAKTLAHTKENQALIKDEIKNQQDTRIAQTSIMPSIQNNPIFDIFKQTGTGIQNFFQGNYQWQKDIEQKASELAGILNNAQQPIIEGIQSKANDVGKFFTGDHTFQKELEQHGLQGLIDNIMTGTTADQRKQESEQAFKEQYKWLFEALQGLGFNPYDTMGAGGGWMDIGQGKKEKKDTRILELLLMSLLFKGKGVT